MHGHWAVHGPLHCRRRWRFTRQHEGVTRHVDDDANQCVLGAEWGCRQVGPNVARWAGGRVEPDTWRTRSMAEQDAQPFDGWAPAADRHAAAACVARVGKPAQELQHPPLEPMAVYHIGRGAHALVCQPHAARPGEPCRVERRERIVVVLAEDLGLQYWDGERPDVTLQPGETSDRHTATLQQEAQHRRRDPVLSRQLPVAAAKIGGVAPRDPTRSRLFRFVTHGPEPRCS